MSEAGPGRLARLGFRLNQIGAVRKVRSWYKHKPRNDQRAIRVLLLFFFVVGLYFLIWQPARNALADATSYYENRRELFQWAKGNEEEIRKLLGQKGTSGKEALGGRSLLTIVTESAKQEGIQLKRFEPKGESAVNLWLEGAPFNEMVVWLDGLRGKYEVRIDQVSVDRDPQKPGKVSVKLQLSV